jgi:hypothetical protein
MTARCAPLVSLALILLAAGCRKPAVEAYRVPKEPAAPQTAAAAPAERPAAPAGGNAMASTAVPTATGAALTWTAPAHWKNKAASGMRKGSYSITADGMEGEADLSVTSLSNDGGGDLANLNRWRGQLSLPPIAQADFESATQHLDRNDLHMTVIDIVGIGMSGKPERILGAIVPYSGGTWFFKMQGPDALVAKEKAAFMAMLDTVKPAPGAP